MYGTRTLTLADPRGRPARRAGRPAQRRLVVALADGFRGGWLEPFQWEHAWRGSELSDEVVLGDARTWLARRPRHDRDPD